MAGRLPGGKMPWKRLKIGQEALKKASNRPKMRLRLSERLPGFKLQLRWVQLGDPQTARREITVNSCRHTGTGGRVAERPTVCQPTVISLSPEAGVLVVGSPAGKAVRQVRRRHSGRRGDRHTGRKEAHNGRSKAAKAGRQPGRHMPAGRQAARPAGSQAARQ